ncbi:MAG: glucose-methanol-choline oxidoreductase [Rhodovulum sulfidophilum]|uniref:Glucose-methanol-choline oxidoreductase n=1 Tax=Rhodovulum sulfidophilum TaxID=35806 RepID=A0A2W5NDU8_RHOSU|nr:MAG: glucose-methanol-choline oxidoreductase [Rhodovulum sulfidophilum]
MAPETRRWDVIVIGAGLGGGVAGRRLAESGLDVLFLEHGPEVPRTDRDLWGDGLAAPADRLDHGLWPEMARGVVDGRETRFFPPLGTGVGGSSALYAATLERPERHDLESTPTMPHPTGGWPIGYDVFRRHLEAAEALLDVRGGPDPLSDETPRLGPPPLLSPGDAAMMAAFRRAGLHPYRKHVGARYLPGCAECFGRHCPRGCKMDGRSAGVEPALRSGRAAVLDRCAVTALRSTAGRVTHVEARRGGVALRLEARVFVLAAGAFGSPRLLLASASEDWPDGLANRSGLVGRNLMFHLNERLAIWPERRADFTSSINTVAMRDFYAVEGARYGHLQSMGMAASYGNILHYLRERFDRSPLAPLRPLRALARLPAFAAARVFGDARIFVGLLEDLAYPGNRVLLDPADPGAIRFEYRLAPELLARRAAFRRLIRARLAAFRAFFLHVEPELNHAHACGTLRFGADPRTSVLDPDCRAHGIANLYVADASFMPSSTGINPSLTIAANALRVAEAVAAAHARGATVA